jgi:hypothetical protein
MKTGGSAVPRTRESMTLSRALRSMDAGEIAAVLRHRPDAAEAARKTRLTVGALAGLLSRRQSILRTIRTLDEYLFNLLVVAVWKGGEATLAEIRDGAGTSDDQLRAGGADLARRALAWLTPGGGTLWVPRCVAEVVEDMGIPGYHARPFLEGRTVAELTGIASNLGLAWKKTPRKAVVIDGLVAALSDARVVHAALSELPAYVADLFHALREDGGYAPWDVLIETGIADYSDQFGGYEREPSALRLLEQRGLVLSSRYGQEAGAYGAVVPGEVEVALSGGRVVPRCRRRPPEPREVVDVPGPERDPEQLVMEAGLLLEWWGAHPATRLKGGGLGTRELRKAAQQTAIDERVVRFIYALLAEGGLLHQDAEVVTPTSQTEMWAERTPAERWDLLFRVWRESLLWSESTEGLIALGKNDLIDHSEIRTAALAALQRLPEGRGMDPESVGAVAYWLRPHIFHCEACAVELIGRVVDGLCTLGVAARSPAIALFEPARSAFVDPQWTERRPEAFTAASPVETCTVQADLTVIVPGPPSYELGKNLALFTELQAVAPARIYRITEGSLRRALDAGSSATEMISLLVRHAPKGVPQAVRYFIDDLARRHGRVRIGEAGVFIRTDQPDQLAAIVADRRVAKFEPSVLAPTVAVVSGVKLAALLKTLRVAGYMPVSEQNGVAVEARTTHPIVRRSDVEPVALWEDEALELAESLLNFSSDSAGPGDGVTERAEIVALLERAMETKTTVEVGYLTDDGLTVEAAVPRVLDRDRAILWADEWPRLIHLDRIGWVRELRPDEAAPR